MNRLIAYRSSMPERLRTVLRGHPGALPGFAGVSDKTPVPGAATEGVPTALPAPSARWGVGFYVGGEPLVQRWSDETGRGQAAVLDLRADNLIAQAHTINGPDAATLTSTAESPFRFRRFTLGAQGDLEVIARERSAVSSELPEFLRANLRGTSQAEALLFQLLLRLHQADPTYLTRPELPAEVAVAALGQVLYAAAPNDASTPAPAQHAALSNGRWLIVARRGPQPLWYRTLVGLGGEEDFRAIFAVADAALEGHASESGLIEIPDNHALMVGPDVDFQIMPLQV